jgi:hypothetical protein
MKRIVYVSTARADLVEDDVRAILAEASARNDGADVTGLLAYNGANFLQAIEGEDVEVDRIYAAIRRDGRHSGVITLVEEPCEQRLFPDWRMRYVRAASRPLLNAQQAHRADTLTPQDIEDSAHLGRLFSGLARLTG